MVFPFLLRIGTYFAAFFLLLFFEGRIPYARSDQKKSFRVSFHLGISIANSLILYFLLTRPTFAILSYTQSHSAGLTHLLRLNGGVEIFLTLVAFDLWDYGMHSANHKLRFLWRFHKVHHSDMEIDVTTAARFHIGELVLSGFSKCLMILFWGPSLWGLIMFDLFVNLASQFHHSNLGIAFKIQDLMEKIIVTPRMHRCHHALHPNCFNTNFSTILNIWDRLFKTYHRVEEGAEIAEVGLPRRKGPQAMRLIPFLKGPFAEP